MAAKEIPGGGGEAGDGDPADGGGGGGGRGEEEQAGVCAVHDGERVYALHTVVGARFRSNQVLSLFPKRYCLKFVNLVY